MMGLMFIRACWPNVKSSATGGEDELGLETMYPTGSLERPVRHQ
jgi:hypothetical protein